VPAHQPCDLGGPYSGIRILDFTQVLQGPAATQVMGDLGADVIKVENASVGDLGRTQGVRKNGMSLHWAANNRNKRSLSIDLKTDRGLELVLALVEDADIVASNFRPGVMEKLGFGHDALSAINPRIISAYASGYGRTGPYRLRRGQDLVGQAMGGVMNLTGGADGPPTPVGTWIIDYLAGMHFAQGMMAALAARDRTGLGQVVDTSLLSSAVSLSFQEAVEWLNVGTPFGRAPAGLAHVHQTALYGVYATADDRHVALVAEYYVDRQWWRVTRALGLPDEVCEDPRFQALAGVLEHHDAASAILVAGFAALPLDHVLARLEEQDVLAAPVYDFEQTFSDPQVLHNEMVVESEHPEVGPLKLVGMPVKLSATPGRVALPPPVLGEHNEAVLAEVGIDAAEVAALHAAGVLGGALAGSDLAVAR
jgi:crotonobetainyl-CoA:carnitine CoA-transferase CaiB-like acyl-CoA transferase